MEFSELVLKRRSVRAYREAEVKEEDVRTMIETAVYAPSWKNREPGRYYVALSKEAKVEVFASLPGFNQNSTKNAAYIVSTYKKGLSGEGSPEGDLWGAYDLGSQNAYLLLKACELGYDTLVMGLRDEERLRAYFGIPEDEILLPVIALGKRNADPRTVIRKGTDEVLKIR